MKQLDLMLLLIILAAAITLTVGSFATESIAITLVIASAFSILFFIRKNSGLILRASGFSSCENDKFRQSLIHISTDAIIAVDEDMVIRLFNKAAQDTFGYSEKEALNHSLFDLVFRSADQDKFIEFLTCCKENNAFSMHSVNQILYSKSGEPVKAATRLAVIKGDDQLKYVFHVVDDNEKQEAEEKLFHVTYHDALTDLPNKIVATKHIEESIAAAKQNGRNLVVMKLGLDRFKHINESMGHDFGDELLVLIANRLKNNLRRGDLVSRFGGDQFLITLVDIQSRSDIEVLVRKYVDIFSAPFELRGRSLHLSASVGAAYYPNDATNVNSLLRNAESAMFHAKAKGGVNYRFYSKELRETSKERLYVENELRNAIVRNQLDVHYQPQVALKTGKIIGVEALVRWTHPELGAVSPIKFIPIAEEIGLISDIGEWVMKRSCADMMLIYRDMQAPLRLSINLSAYQFLEHNLVSKIANILNVTKFPAHSLELEITESLLMENADEVVETLNILSKQGISISMDDFGTGYSSLSYLKRFPIDTIKVDQSFVKDITSDQDNASIVTATIQMAHSLSLDIVAEGVETEDQLKFLLQKNCDKIQGYYFSRPLKFKALKNLLEEDRQIDLNSDKICLISRYR